MPQLDKNRLSTPLERQIFQALVDVAVELELKSIEPELVSEAVEDGLREAGLAISNRLLETMDEAVGDEEEERKGFEQRLQRLWSPALERLQALIIAASEAGATFALERRSARRWGRSAGLCHRLPNRPQSVVGQITITRSCANSRPLDPPGTRFRTQGYRA